MAQCTATSKQSGQRCRRHASKGHTVCAMHGGKSLAGVDSPQFKHGRYSRHLPDRLVDSYGNLLADKELLRLDDEIALVGTRLQDLLGRLREAGEGPTAWAMAQAAYTRMVQGIESNNEDRVRAALHELHEALTRASSEQHVWDQLLGLVEQRRKLVDTERKRLADEDQAIAVDKLMLLMAAMVDIVRRHVASKEARSAIAAEIRQLAAGTGGTG